MKSKIMCGMKGCPNEVSIFKKYCSKQCKFYSDHSFSGETLEEYNKRKARFKKTGRWG